MTNEKRLDVLARHKITLDSVFVPFDKSRNKDSSQPSLNWKVTLRVDGREVITTDYMAGCGHCPAYKSKAPAKWARPEKYWKQYATAHECQHGFKAKLGLFASDFDGIVSDKTQPLKPDILGVVSSLLLDSEVLNFGTFESWASEFGYDADSRKAESIYNDCLRIALAVRNGFGDSLIRTLTKVFEGY